MSLQYSTGTLINRTFSVAVRQDWVTAVTQACSDAGWSTVSGTPGSGADVTMDTAAGNLGQKARVRFLEPGSGNCAQAFLKHTNGAVTSQTFFAYGGAGSWRVIANKFHFFSTITGSANRLTARSNLCGGLLYTPSFLNLSPGDCNGFMQGNGQTDTDAGSHSSWRTCLRSYDNSNAGGLFSGIYVATLLNASNYTNNTGAPSIACWQGGYYAGDTHYRWEDTTLPIFEPLVGYGTAGVLTNEGRLKGQLYDAAVVNGSYTSETQITFDGHTWLAWSDQITGGIACDASLFLAVA